jgi:hypothetical protein
MSNLTTRAVYLGLVAVAFSLAIVALRWSVAALDLLVVKQQVQEMYSPATTSEPAAAHSQQAAGLQPLNADIYAVRAYYHMLAASKLVQSPEAQSKSLKRAQSALDIALGLRPASGHLWALYAEATYALEGPSPSVRHALRRCAELAPIQQAVVMRELSLYLQLISTGEPLSDRQTHRLSDVLSIIASGSKKLLASIAKDVDGASLLLPFSNDAASAQVLQAKINARETR